MIARRGFTLIELLLVILILGVLAAIVIPRVATSRDDVMDAACEANIANINVQIERYYIDIGSWPSTDLSEMVPPTTYDYFPDGLPTCPVDGSSYTMSTTTHRISHSH